MVDVTRFEDTALWRLKVRLQFTGWLQYLIPAVWVLILLLLAGIGWFIGHWPLLLFWLPLAFAAVLSIAIVGNIIIVKYGIHPSERIPPGKADWDAFDLMRARHSCRSFQPRNLTPEHRAELVEAIRDCSLPEHLVGQRPIRFEYVAAPLTVWPVVGAHEFLVAIAPKEYDRLAVIDVGRSLQRIVLHATRMGLATCWIGPGADHQSVIEHLGDRFDSEQDHIICVCALGYESMFKPLFIRLMQRVMHRRLPLSELFFTDATFVKPLDTKAKPYRDYGRCYEVCQWSPSSYNGQTTRCAASTTPVDHEVELLRFDFYAATESRYYAPLAVGIWCANWETGCESLNTHGHFAVLSPDERDAATNSELPRYDISWVIE